MRKYKYANVNEQYTEADIRRCSGKKVFLKILPNTQENTYVGVFFLIKLQTCNFNKKERDSDTGVFL